MKREITIQGKHFKTISFDINFKERDKKNPVIIFSHGFKGFKDWGPFNLMSDYFADNNFVFIKLNFSHNGVTDGEFTDLDAFGKNNFVKELDDLQSVIDHIHNSEYQIYMDLENITLMGHSRGGGISILKASEEKRITKLVTLASVSDFSRRFGNIEKWQKDKVLYVENSRTKQNMPLYYQFYENFLDNRDRLDILSASEKLNIPFLLIHGSKDLVVDIRDAYELEKQNPNIEMKVIPNTGHTFGAKHPHIDLSLPKKMEEVLKQCLNFLEK
ncbi:alpha/beta hydrolase family protein [Ichthyobacterium seriolicida]|uniref:Alpha/beta hydrolase n=1 Tax=Ichthyobacterium seriolicida TaxID=242600 RepID=A0A1J1DYG0_9FLAO|nr:alpha/beta fold hydrolase [Ichthyobacterium seriolicida]BAV94905.1 alpha/beta hydrolase [Ichthyobacterium seriolicida]